LKAGESAWLAAIKRPRVTNTDMRSILLALLVFGTTACLRASTVDPDAASNGNNNNNGGGGADASSGGGTPDSGGTVHHDAGNTGGMDSGMSMPDAMMGPPCKNKVTTNLGNGHHNAGQDCQNSCHNHGFTLSGTLYSSVSGGTVVAGASITVKDAGGNTFDMVSQSDGNFYTTNFVQFPVTVYASECQISQMSQVMTDPVNSGQGGCNKSGCHTTASQGRIHLP
jgi:hypothetical protein